MDPWFGGYICLCLMLWIPRHRWPMALRTLIRFIHGIDSETKIRRLGSTLCSLLIVTVWSFLCISSTSHLNVIYQCVYCTLVACLFEWYLWHDSVSGFDFHVESWLLVDKVLRLNFYSLSAKKKIKHSFSFIPSSVSFVFNFILLDTCKKEIHLTFILW